MALAFLAGCSPEPEAPDASTGVSSEFGVRHHFIPRHQFEITKHVWDAERYERVGMIEAAEREFWFAELKLFGLRDWTLQGLAPRVREARLRLRSRRPPAGG